MKSGRSRSGGVSCTDVVCCVDCVEIGGAGTCPGGATGFVLRSSSQSFKTAIITGF
jgi:hypothetical protein